MKIIISLLILKIILLSKVCSFQPKIRANAIRKMNTAFERHILKVEKPKKDVPEAKIPEKTIEKTVVVTGANKGIGYGICRLILKKGLKYNIVLCSRNKKNGDEAVGKLINEFPKYKDKVIAGNLDVTSKKSIDTFYDWIKTKKKNVDVIFNNAGISINKKLD